MRVRQIHNFHAGLSKHLFGIAQFVTPGVLRRIFIHNNFMSDHHLDSRLNNGPAAVGARSVGCIHNTALKRRSGQAGIINGIALGVFKKIVLGRPFQTFRHIVITPRTNPLYPVARISRSGPTTMAPVLVEGSLEPGSDQFRNFHKPFVPFFRKHPSVSLEFILRQFYQDLQKLQDLFAVWPLPDLFFRRWS